MHSGQPEFRGEPMPAAFPLQGLAKPMGPPDEEMGEAWMALVQLVSWAAPRPRGWTFIPAGQTAPPPEFKPCLYCHVLQDHNAPKHLDGCLVGDACKLTSRISARCVTRWRYQSAVLEAVDDADVAAVEQIVGRLRRGQVWRLTTRILPPSRRRAMEA